MNKTIQDIIERRRVKKYMAKSVPDELIEQIVKAGPYAPSGMNKQAAIILAVTNKEMRDRLSSPRRSSSMYEQEKINPPTRGERCAGGGDV